MLLLTDFAYIHMLQTLLFTHVAMSERHIKQCMNGTCRINICMCVFFFCCQKGNYFANKLKIRLRRLLSGSTTSEGIQPQWP